MKLHLGCGKRRFEGYINIDLYEGDVTGDIRKLPYEDNTADEIIAIHVVEHFYIQEVASILREWMRVLKPGGRLIIELPCWDKVRWLISQGAPDNLTRWPLFGDPSTHSAGEPALHKWCWSMEEMEALLVGVRFENVEIKQPEFHVKHRDMRLEATK